MSQLKVWTPWSVVPSAWDDMDDLFPVSMSKMPTVDIMDKGDHYLLEAHLMGFDPKKVKVTVEGDVVKLVGQAEEEHEEKKEKYIHRETSHRSFSRSFTLPAEIDSEGVVAKVDKGTLVVTLPKSAKARSRDVEIQVE